MQEHIYLTIKQTQDMKQSVTLEQVAKNLGTTVEWKMNVLSENGFTLLNPTTLKYLPSEKHNELTEAIGELRDENDLSADEKLALKTKINSIIKSALAKLKRLSQHLNKIKS